MRLILISHNADDRRVFEPAANRAGMSFQQFSASLPAVDEISQNPDTFVVVDASTQAAYSSFEKVLSDKLGLFSTYVNPNLYCFVANHPLGALSYLAHSQICGHFLERRYIQDDKSQDEFFTLFLKRSSAPNVFGFENHFSALGLEPKVETFVLKHAQERYGILEGLRNFLRRWDIGTREAFDIVSAADELLMYAVFEAPTDDLGKALYLQTHRVTALSLKDRAEVTLKLIQAQDWFAISVEDQFGSFDRQKILASVGRDFSREEFRPRPTLAGGETGLYQVSRQGMGFFASVDPGIKGELTCLFRRTLNYREFRQQLRIVSTHVEANT